jgi:hypothetical protein
MEARARPNTLFQKESDMKTILRIITILLVASVVAGAFLLALNNSSVISSSSEGGERPAMTDASGQSIQPMERLEGGDRDGGSIAQGLSGVLATLMKLSIITILILVTQKGMELLNRRRWKTIAR